MVNLTIDFKKQHHLIYLKNIWS